MTCGCVCTPHDPYGDLRGNPSPQPPQRDPTPSPDRLPTSPPHAALPPPVWITLSGALDGQSRVGPSLSPFSHCSSSSSLVSSASHASLCPPETPCPTNRVPRGGNKGWKWIYKRGKELGGYDVSETWQEAGKCCQVRVCVVSARPCVRLSVCPPRLTTTMPMFSLNLSVAGLV